MSALVTIDPTLFRTYDIRGIVDETLTTETVHEIGKAVGSLVRESGETHLAVGRDGRHSSQALAKALCDGVRSVGCHVIDLGMVPTPLLYYATHQLSCRSGVMVTGSHNPPNYNGFKMVVGGKTLAAEAITQLYKRIVESRYTLGSGSYLEANIQDLYLKEVTQRVKLVRPLKIVIDAGNGVAGRLAPALFHALGCEVKPLFCDVDGSFPHHHPDPSDASNMQDLIHAVRDGEADVGLAFDGDGDRLGVVSNAGEIIWPDRLLILFARALLAEEPAATIIYDVKCTHYLAPMIQQFGGKPLMWKTGHSLIKAKLAETQAALAGEMSGHFFFKHRWYGFDDALYAGARLLEIIAAQSETCETLFAAMPNSVNTPELKVYVTDKEKFELIEQLVHTAVFPDAEIVTIDGLRINFADGWGLVRPSNTTPCLVLRFEAKEERVLKIIQERFRVWLLSVKPDLVLPF